MNDSRRSFLKKSALALTAAAVFPRLALAEKATDETVTGLQLYSVRDAMKEDPLDTLTKLAKMGYRNVEHAGYANRKFYGYSVPEFKKVLADLDLKMPCGHTVMRAGHWDAQKKDFSDEWKQTVDDAAEMGQHYVISPWLDESLRTDYDRLSAFLEIFNKSGELCQKSGMKFGYHNHDFEFGEKLNGKKIYDIIMEQTDPKLVAQQLDIGNMYISGGRAAEVLKQYPGRFELIHVKDEIKVPGDEKYESTVLGKGIIGTKEVIDLGRKMGGTKYFIIEQESYQKQDPLACMDEDLKIMKQWGY